MWEQWMEDWKQAKERSHKMAKVEESQLDQLIEQSKKKIWHPFPTVTIVAMELPSGFVISGQSACIDPANFDEELGINIAIEDIKSKLWELEGYRIMSGGCGCCA